MFLARHLERTIARSGPGLVAATASRTRPSPSRSGCRLAVVAVAFVAGAAFGAVSAAKAVFLGSWPGPWPAVASGSFGPGRARASRTLVRGIVRGIRWQPPSRTDIVVGPRPGCRGRAPWSIGVSSAGIGGRCRGRGRDRGSWPGACPGSAIRGVLRLTSVPLRVPRPYSQETAEQELPSGPWPGSCSGRGRARVRARGRGRGRGRGRDRGRGRMSGIISSFALTAWPSYGIARIWLALRHRLPWQLMGFLADAHRRGVLRQAGAVYQFRHIELQHRLANRDAKAQQESSSTA